MEIVCSSVDELVSRVFTPIPSPPHSIQLEILNAQNSHDIFRTLGQLLTYGVVFLYGNNVCLNDIDTHRLQQYMASVGWKIILDPKSSTDHPRALPYLLCIPNGDLYVNVIFEPL